MEKETTRRIKAGSAALLMLVLPTLASAQIDKKGCVTRFANGHLLEFCSPTLFPPSPPVLTPTRPWELQYQPQYRERESREREYYRKREDREREDNASASRARESRERAYQQEYQRQYQRQYQPPPRTADPGSVTTSPSGLVPVRALIEPSEMPPKDVGAYGIVAFTAMPLPNDAGRHSFVCEAFKATLIPQESVPANTPLLAQMITYWPINSKATELAQRLDCKHLVAEYNLKTGLDAITDADRKGEELATRRGPFLIAWSPAKSRSEKDVVVLVMELSNLESQESFVEVFKAWRQKIVDDPKLWQRGWDWQSVRLALRDTLDRYGEGIVRLVQQSKE